MTKKNSTDRSASESTTDTKGQPLTHRSAHGPVPSSGVKDGNLVTEPPERIKEWAGNMLGSGLLRAMAEAGGRGKGKRARSASYSPLVVYLSLLASRPESPSILEMQRVTGIGSKNTVKAALEILEALGAIRWHRGRHGHTYEILHLPDLGLPEPSPSARRGRRSRKDEPTTFRSPDGHVLRSWLELVVDLLLLHKKIPHFVEIPYQAIFPGHEGKHTMDFMLSPSVGVEVWGASGPDYKQVRKKKESLAVSSHDL